MSPNSAIVGVPLSTQLLAFAVLMQFIAIMAVVWRGIFGLPQLSSRRPRWPFIPLILGCGAGVWYAWIQSDLVFGVAQGLALFIGFCLINSSRGLPPAADGPAKNPRTDKKDKRAARRAGNGDGK
ncbi:MAG: hypothetical protein AUJ49_06480 [Desulfovibrionaceae bacterium CG1_02_65_16]|nr:MAG: hypothetical protein AUJ49_06480 [Desulfovibrionaceae bacterium CG1_02_65_16]